MECHHPRERHFIEHRERGTNPRRAIIRPLSWDASAASTRHYRGIYSDGSTEDLRRKENWTTGRLFKRAESSTRWHWAREFVDRGVRTTEGDASVSCFLIVCACAHYLRITDLIIIYTPCIRRLLPQCAQQSYCPPIRHSNSFFLAPNKNKANAKVALPSS